MKSLIPLILCGVLAGAVESSAADAPKLPAAEETDARLHADGKGWGLDKAKVTDPHRPRVLLIGDSILNGYKKHVIEALRGKAYVDAWVNPYCQSQHVNKLVAEVLEQGPYDVVHFNMGLHGWQEGRIKPGTFKPLTRAYVEVIRKKLPDAKIIWASSTPVTVRGKPTQLEPEINPVIVEHNRMAAEVMAEMKVPVNDFYALLAGKLELARGDRFHWTAPAYEALGRMVTQSVLRELKTPEAGVTLRQETRFPEEDTTRLTLTCREPKEGTLKIRHPAWAVSGATVTLNGKKQDVPSRLGVFRIAGSAAPVSVTLEPIYRMHGERPYVVYWDRLTEDQWQTERDRPLPVPSRQLCRRGIRIADYEAAE